MNPDATIQRLCKALPDLRQRFAVAQLGIFGSVARGTAGPESDIDILVELEGPATLDGFMGMDRSQFAEDWRTQDATLRNLEILGEAVKHLPGNLASLYPDVAWKNIAGFRDFLAHAYFGVDEEIVWDSISTKLDPLETAVQALIFGL